MPDEAITTLRVSLPAAPSGNTLTNIRVRTGCARLAVGSGQVDHAKLKRARTVLPPWRWHRSLPTPLAS